MRHSKPIILAILILLLMISSVSTFAQPVWNLNVSPVLECVYAKADGTFEARFGYENRMDKTVESPIGTYNTLIPNSYNGLQPTTFTSGRKVNVFQVPFTTGSTVMWKLSSRSATASTTTPSRCKPNTPTMTATPNGETQVDLTWTPVDGVNSYSVFVSYGAPGATITKETYATNATTFSHTGLACGMVYTYSVAARGVERSSDASQPLSIKTVVCPPTAPAEGSVTVEAGLNGVRVSVTPDANIDEYRLETFDGVNWVSLGTSTDGNFDVSNLACGTSYTFRVAAVNASGEAVSEAITVTTDVCPPAMPNNVNVSLDLNSITVTFTPETGVEYRAEAWNGEAWVTMATSTDGTLSLDNLNCGTTYTVRVVAANPSGETATPEMQIPMPVCPPATPLASASATSMTDITVSWNAVENAVGYRVEMLQGEAWVVVAQNVSATSYTVSNLACGTAYNFRVAAFNTSGEATSQTAYAETLVCPPTAPTDINVNAGGGNANSAAFVWTMQTNTTYRVEQWDGSVWTTVVSNAQGSFDMSNLACGTTYTFRVVATNASGEAPSQSVIITTAICPPAAPMASAAALTTIDIAVSWDAAPNATSYRVEMQQGETWSTLNTTSDLSYNVGGLTCATSYTFRVVAVNASGEAPSTPTSAMTNACGPVQLIQNGSFEAQAANWSIIRPTSEAVRCNPAKPVAYEGQCFFLFRGGAKERSVLRQVIDTTAMGIDSTTPLTFSAAVRATKMSAGFQMSVTMFYADGTKTVKVSNLPRNTKNAYRVVTRTYTPDKPVIKIIVLMRYTNAAAVGNTRVDSVSLTYLPPAPTSAAPAAVEGLIPLPQAPQQ